MLRKLLHKWICPRCLQALLNIGSRGHCGNCANCPGCQK
jgi:hypothetical protein